MQLIPNKKILEGQEVILAPSELRRVFPGNVLNTLGEAWARLDPRYINLALGNSCITAGEKMSHLPEVKGLNPFLFPAFFLPFDRVHLQIGLL